MVPVISNHFSQFIGIVVQAGLSILYVYSDFDPWQIPNIGGGHVLSREVLTHQLCEKKYRDIFST